MTKNDKRELRNEVRKVKAALNAGIDTLMDGAFEIYIYIDEHKDVGMLPEEVQELIDMFENLTDDVNEAMDI